LYIVILGLLTFENSCRRTDDDAKTEYTSWSKRTASSYLPPERRMQLWRDIDDFGLPDDGYDYTMHLRNPGAGVRLDANFSDDVVKFLEKKETLERAQADKHTREILKALEASDDDEAPALEDDEEAAVQEWAEKGKQKVEAAEVVEEGELDDDFIRALNDSGDEEEAEDPLLSQPRDLRLLDEQFNNFLSAYDDDKIGELSGDVKPSRPVGAPQEDEEYYRELLQSYINGTAMPPGVKMVGRVEEDEEYEDDDGQPRWQRRTGTAKEYEECGDDVIAGFEPIHNDYDEEEMKDILAKTAALGLAAGDGDSDDSLEEIEVQDKVEWDCESIVSTYSNIYNHPKQIADSRKQVPCVDAC
jgi:protein LTV1